jgi:enoyl-CoA hydratase/carnithine racemase
MEYIHSINDQGIVTVRLSRGKVNALNETVVDEMTGHFKELAADAGVRAIILTGTGKFFTFGFDIPEFLSYPRESFIRYLTKFTDLYTYLFLYPKPVVAALNGHTIAGGCMLAIACDYRIMVSGKAKISLNEINFGSSMFLGSVEMMKLLLGQRNAERAVYTGTMYSADEAHGIGLIDQISSEADLEAEAKKIAGQYAEKDAAAFKSIKKLLRGTVAEEIMKRERDCILEFVDIWYSESTWKNLQGKNIHS